MRKIFLTLVFLLFLGLVGCGFFETEPEVLQVSATLPQTAATTATEAEISYLSLVVERANQWLGKHESPYGLLLGINVQHDFAVGSISELGLDHAIFAHEMQLGDDFPLRWVLENIALHSAPLIILHPPESGIAFDFELLEQFAQDLALFNAPAFVQLYPLRNSVDFVPLEYVAFFQGAFGLFSRIAPNAALVWAFDEKMLAYAEDFFPGAGALHWINMTAYNHICAEGEFLGIADNLGVFQEKFGSHAPLMLTTAVSSYSMESNRHFPAQATEKIVNLYSSLAHFPRIRAVVYQNYSDLSGAGADFRMNASTVLLDAYRDATAATHFVTAIYEGSLARTETVVQLSPHKAVARGRYFYIPTNAMNLPDAERTLINGQAYHPLAEILQLEGWDFFVNLHDNTLTLQFKP